MIGIAWTEMRRPALQRGHIVKRAPESNPGTSEIYTLALNCNVLVQDLLEQVMYRHFVLLLDGIKPADFAIFASILPKGKYDLVKAFQKNGRTVGMCGDGANDAPALRQAQIGIAVSTATDVAKSAAGVVLTEAGLGGIVGAVKEGRVTFQRILTYTLNSVLKKIVQVLLLAIGLVMTGHAILTPMLMVIVMITGDFLAMSLTTDRVRPSARPNAWQIGRITSALLFWEVFFSLSALRS
jgi:magnesium-transporting ATPase (P-type)